MYKEYKNCGRNVMAATWFLECKAKNVQEYKGSSKDKSLIFYQIGRNIIKLLQREDTHTYMADSDNVQKMAGHERKKRHCKNDRPAPLVNSTCIGTEIAIF